MKRSANPSVDAALLEEAVVAQSQPLARHRTFSRRVASLKGQADEIADALDMLFYGF